MTAYCPLCNNPRASCTCRPDDVYGPEPYRSARVRTTLEEELLAALKGMERAAQEIAIEFIEHRRAANWKIINDAYVACAKAIREAEA